MKEDTKDGAARATLRALQHARAVAWNLLVQIEHGKIDLPEFRRQAYGVIGGVVDDCPTCGGTHTLEDADVLLRLVGEGVANGS